MSGNPGSSAWYSINNLSKCKLNLKVSLNGGQSFRWKEIVEGEWTGVIGLMVWRFRWNKDKNNLEYKVWCENMTGLEESYLTKKVHNYFRLGTDLESLYEKWANCDKNFKLKIENEQLHGIRLLSQNPVENIFSFICSSNNNISRISKMVENMCKLYGKKICDVENTTYYTFPEIEELAKEGVEAKLRQVGFGYRAPFITGTAKKILEKGGLTWLDDLTKMEYSNAKQELMSLPGIGAKVADCICLMSLGHLQAVPVDTHVYQIAVKHYTPHLRGKKSVTTKIYNEITLHFQDLYGPFAGWAHTVLFCADLKSLTDNKRNCNEESDVPQRKRSKKK